MSILEIYERAKSDFVSKKQVFYQQYASHQALYRPPLDRSLPPTADDALGISQQWLMHGIGEPLRRLGFQCQLLPQQLLWLLGNYYHKRWSELHEEILQRYIVEGVMTLIGLFSEDILDTAGGRREHHPYPSSHPKRFIQRTISRINRRFEALDILFPQLIKRQAPDSMLHPPYSKVWIEKTTAWLDTQTRRVTELAWVHSEMKSFGLEPQVFELPIAQKEIEQERTRLSAHKLHLAEQEELSANIKYISGGYQQLGLTSPQFTPPFNPTAVREAVQSYEKCQALFLRFDKLEALCSTLGWPKKCSPKERLAADVEQVQASVDVQRFLKKEYLQLRKEADEQDIFCPEYALPFDGEAIEAIRDDLTFVQK